MSIERYKYDPDICDGDFCPGDCDMCSKGYGREEPDDSQLEMGFDPYAGAYTYDC